MKSKLIATLTREKLYARGSNAEWSWLYRLNGVAHGTVLAAVEGYARRKNMVPIRTWER